MSRAAPLTLPVTMTALKISIWRRRMVLQAQASVRRDSVGKIIALQRLDRAAKLYAIRSVRVARLVALITQTHAAGQRIGARAQRRWRRLSLHRRRNGWRRWGHCRRCRRGNRQFGRWHFFRPHRSGGHPGRSPRIVGRDKCRRRTSVDRRVAGCSLWCLGRQSASQSGCLHRRSGRRFEFRDDGVGRGGRCHRGRSLVAQPHGCGSQDDYGGSDTEPQPPGSTCGRCRATLGPLGFERRRFGPRGHRRTAWRLDFSKHAVALKKYRVLYFRLGGARRGHRLGR